jgi:hypothetical protein
VVSPEKTPRREPLDAKQLDDLWDRLVSTKAPDAYGALCQQADHHNESQPLLRDRLRPAPSIDPKRLARLIAALDDDSFAVRQNAEQESKGLGEAAPFARREVLEGEGSAQLFASIQRILATLVRGMPSDKLAGRLVKGARTLPRPMGPEGTADHRRR